MPIFTICVFPGLRQATVRTCGNDSEQVILRLFFDSMPAAHVEVASIQPVGILDLLKRFLKAVAKEQSPLQLFIFSFYFAFCSCEDVDF